MKNLLLVLCFFSLQSCSVFFKKQEEIFYIKSRYETEITGNNSLPNPDPEKSGFDFHFSFFNDSYNSLQFYELCEYCAEPGGGLDTKIIIKNTADNQEHIIIPLSCADKEFPCSIGKERDCDNHKFRKKVTLPMSDNEINEYNISLHFFCFIDQKRTELEIGSFVAEKGEIRDVEIKITKIETREIKQNKPPVEPIGFK